MSKKVVVNKVLVYVLEYRVDAENVLDGMDGVREALTAMGSFKLLDVRVEEVPR